MKMRAIKRQKGAYLVIMTSLMVVLIGVGALAIDTGRLYVMRSEMQNAADAAAIAAAMELNNTPGARARAASAARNLLQHNSKFAQVSDLLGVNISLEYFCAIGAKYDPTPKQINKYCTNGYVDGRSVATNDGEAKYVRVRLEPSEDNEAYTLQLLFLPVLNATPSDVPSRASLSAQAVAGRSQYMCDFPPMMLCNPFEETGQNFDTAMNPGDQIILRQQGGGGEQGGQWAPGNFGFLEPHTGGGGAPVIANYLADEHITGCAAPILTTSTGQMTNQTTNGLNTRFDLYSAPGFNNAADDYPPAPNVIDFPRDQTWRDALSRFGNGDWNRDTYFATYHDWQMHGRPGGWADMTRWEVYNWELENDKLPSKYPLMPGNTDTSYDGIPTPEHLYFGEWAPAPSVADRRKLLVGVVNCLAHGITGNTTFPMIDPTEGFANIFLSEHASGPPNAAIYGEYIDWAGNADDKIFTDVQLYE